MGFQLKNRDAGDMGARKRCELLFVAASGSRNGVAAVESAELPPRQKGNSLRLEAFASSEDICCIELLGRAENLST